VTNPAPRRVCAQHCRFVGPCCDEESISRCAFGRDGKSTGVASRFGNTSRRQSSPVGKPTEAAGARKFGERDGRSLPRQARAYQTALLRTNRRISDPISQAVEDDLRKPR